MTVRLQKYTGYGNSFALLKYLTPWSEAFGTKGSMRFYDGPVDLVVDVVPGYIADEIIIDHYPHNPSTPDIQKIVEEKMERIVSLFNKFQKISPRKQVTMDLSGEVSIVTKEKFSRYFPKTEVVDELFIFDADTKEGFPQIFVYEKNHRLNDGKDTLLVLTLSSTSVMPCADKSSQEGKEFTYILLNSGFHRGFKSETPPLGGINFPTKEDVGIPRYLRTDALDKFVNSFDTEELTVGKEGINEAYEGEPVDEPDDESDEEFARMFQDQVAHDDLIEQTHVSKLAEKMQKDILEKDTVSLLDAFQLGLSETLALVPNSDKIIGVETDMAGVVRKMCIYEGIFHVIPFVGVDSTDFLDISDEQVHFCTEETFPKKFLPPTVTNLLQ